MAELQTLARRHIMAGFYDPECSGVSLVLRSQRLKLALAAWAIDRFMGTSCKMSDLHAMYVALSYQRLVLVQERVRQLRYSNNLLVSDSTPKIRGKGPNRRLTPLKEVNYATFHTIQTAAAWFPSGCLNLLVLDEWGARGSRRLVRFAHQAQPTFTIILTQDQPPPNWPWRYLGKPLDVTGAASAA